MVNMVDVVYIIILEDDTFYKDGGVMVGHGILSATQVHAAQFFSKDLADIKSLELLNNNVNNKILPLVLTVVPKIEY